jgi:cytochrome c oxidase subunit 2
MREKVARIQEIRKEKNVAITAEGGEPLTDYNQFDYYLLCNKICGVAHYNMQMKIVVETQEEYEAWMAEQKEFSETMEPLDGAQPESDVEVAQVDNK